MMSRSSRAFALLAACAALAACVTINVYFPAAAAEKAADRIIDEVWGEEAAPAPQSALPRFSPAALAAVVLDVLVPAAHAQQANIDLSSPSIERIKRSMQTRHGQLAPMYDAGAIGLTEDGSLAVRDASAAPLSKRGTLKALVAKENADRGALYGEIARANGHPEWEPQIRATFSRRWIDKARGGWWYRDGGTWRQR